MAPNTEGQPRPVEHGPLSVLELDTPEKRRAYAAKVWQLIVKTYEEYGNSEDGNLYGADIENLIETPGSWVLAERDGQLLAGVIFRKFKGNKMRLVLHNNTREGKDELKELFLSEFKAGRCWGEVSGHLERILRERGIEPVPNTKAADILEKKITKLDPDGVHYEREVYPDVKKTETLYGTVEA